MLAERELSSVEVVVLGAITVHLLQRHGLAEEGVPTGREVHPAAERPFGVCIEAAVQRKVEGQEIAISTEAEQQPAGQVIDLMEALRASLAKTTAKRAGEKKAEAPAAEAAKTASRKPPKKVAAEAPEPKRKVAKR